MGAENLPAGRVRQPGRPAFQQFDAEFPGIPARGRREQRRGQEQTGIPIDIETRLTELDNMWGIPREIGETSFEATNIMDDRLNLLHQEVLAIGDQASIHTIAIVNFTFKFEYFNFLTHEKRVALHEALNVWYENSNPPLKYLITAREKKLVNECSERSGNGSFSDYESNPYDYYTYTPTLEDIYDYNF